MSPLSKPATLIVALWAAWLVYHGVIAESGNREPYAGSAAPAPEFTPTEYAPEIAPASDEAERQIASFRLREGFTARLVAAEPLIANPVAFWMDWRGHCYVAESFRQETEGVPDNRSHTYWIPDDLEAETVADRSAMYLKHHPDYAEKWTKEQDRIRVLIDDDRDGVADRSEVFADGFDDLLDGTGAGVMSIGRDVFYTCIPHLWRLRDEDGDGFAETRTKLHSGYGVRVALRGHDMHGLVRGPDGKLYFSIGDRGYDVTTPEGKHLADPRSGAVFRCNLDGSGLEVYATGLRNPQELAFDDFGNLFTGDNNGDGGDKARIVFVAEGGETGWRMNYQYIHKRGPWVKERWFEPEFEGRVAAYLPPIANLGAGPSGFVCYPGTGLPASYDGWFFLCDFLGSSGSSGIRAFELEPRGAGFALGENHWFVKGLLATDCDFGADGVLYASDWVQGWVGEGKGRLYAFEHEAAREPAVRETRRLLAGGIARMPFYRHLKLLGHPDRRVRLEAQFACATRGVSAVAPLERVLREAEALRPRLHALWALGQMQAKAPDLADLIAAFLDDEDAEIRAQAARLLGDGRVAAAAPALRRRLSDDPSDRVRYFAALSLGKLGDAAALPSVIANLERNADRDVFLRHALVMALVGPGAAAADALEPHANHGAAAVRLGVLLAWRRLGDPRAARFLTDAKREIVVEAARAIYDQPIPGAYPALAALPLKPDANGRWQEGFALAKRILGSRDLLSRAEDAGALAAAAVDEALPKELRRFALRALETWDPAPRTEPLLNDVRPRPARDLDVAAAAIGPRLPKLLASAPDAVREIAARFAARLPKGETIDRALRELVRAPRAGAGPRAAALSSLAQREASELEPLIAFALASDVPRLRGQAASVLADQDPARALPLLGQSLQTGKVAERQLALRTLARLENPAADTLLAARFDRFLEKREASAELLELVEAVKGRAKGGAADLELRVTRYSKSLEEADAFTRHLPSLLGGDVAKGRRLFNGTKASCVRCHALVGERSELAGPPLNDVARRLDRKALLTSIVEPNAVIAAGYATALIETRDGDLFDGRILEENEERLVVEVMDSGEPERVEVRVADIAFRKRSASAMPTDLGEKLSPAELRDLVAFLASLDGGGSGVSPGKKSERTGH